MVDRDVADQPTTEGLNEYETEPVPEQARRSLRSVAALWYGFPMNFVPAVFGGTLCALIGFQGALLAIVLGSLALFLYVGTIGYLSGRTGQNFALQARSAFGTIGYLLIAGSLATIVVGWFAFNSGFIGATLNQTFGWSEWVMTLLASVAFVLVTLIGVKGLSVLGMIAAPVFILSAIVALVLVLPQANWGDVWNYPGVAGAGALTLGAGVTMVFAMFADSGTMGADFTRWARSGREAVIATATAFPLGNLFAFGSGALLVATGTIQDAATAGGNIVTVLASGNGFIVAALAVICALISIASVNAHCLYNAALSWGNLVKMRMQILCLVLGTIATIVAVSGAWNHLATWLSFLGVFVPPIGGVLIASGLIALKRATAEPVAVRFNWMAFVAYGIGAVLAGVTYFQLPMLSDAIVGLVGGAVAYWLISAVAPRSAQS